MSTMNIAELRAQSRSRSALDFPGTIRSHYPYWDAQFRPYLIFALDALPAEQFGFKPRPEMLTAHQTLLHLAEAEQVWMNIIEGKAFEEWVVELDDPSQGYKTLRDVPDHASLQALLEECHRPTQRWFDRPVSELGRVVTYRASDGVERQYTLHWI